MNIDRKSGRDDCSTITQEVYLGGCKTFLNPCLPQGFVDKGAQSAVGWKVEIVSWNPFRDEAPHEAFRDTLCGDMSKKTEGKTVQEAADASGCTYRGFIDLDWNLRPAPSVFIGVAGKGSIKLYD